MVSRVLQDRITLLPIGRLETWPSGNARKTNVFEDIQELADNIHENGLLSPLLVVKKPDSNKYWVVAGQRRLEACRLINYDDVECVIIRDMDEDEAKVLSLSENLYRSQMNPDDISESVDYLYKKYGEISKVAKRLGVSNSTVRRYVRYRELPREMKDSVSEKKISPSQAVSIYVKFPDKDRQVRIAEHLAALNEDKPKKARTFKAIKTAPPTADVPEIRETEIRLRDSKSYDILLYPSTYQPIEKVAKAQDEKPANIMSEILENWVENRTNKGLSIVD